VRPTHPPVTPYLKGAWDAPYACYYPKSSREGRTVNMIIFGQCDPMNPLRAVIGVSSSTSDLNHSRAAIYIPMHTNMLLQISSEGSLTKPVACVVGSRHILIAINTEITGGRKDEFISDHPVGLHAYYDCIPSSAAAAIGLLSTSSFFSFVSLPISGGKAVSLFEPRYSPVSWVN